MGAEKILLFPTFILDKDLHRIRNVTDLIRFQVDYAHTNLRSQKDLRDLSLKFQNLNFAQNVLTQYQIKKNKIDFLIFLIYNKFFLVNSG